MGKEDDGAEGDGDAEHDGARKSEEEGQEGGEVKAES